MAEPNFTIPTFYPHETMTNSENTKNFGSIFSHAHVKLDVLVRLYENMVEITKVIIDWIDARIINTQKRTSENKAEVNSPLNIEILQNSLIKTTEESLKDLPCEVQNLIKELKSCYDELSKIKKDPNLSALNNKLQNYLAKLNDFLKQNPEKEQITAELKKIYRESKNNEQTTASIEALLKQYPHSGLNQQDISQLLINFEKQKENARLGNEITLAWKKAKADLKKETNGQNVIVELRDCQVELASIDTRLKTSLDNLKERSAIKELDDVINNFEEDEDPTPHDTIKNELMSLQQNIRALEKQKLELENNIIYYQQLIEHKLNTPINALLQKLQIYD